MTTDTEYVLARDQEKVRPAAIPGPHVGARLLLVHGAGAHAALWALLIGAWKERA